MGKRNGDRRERIFVGDVHGCADELEELLDRLEFDPNDHALWFVGDLVNRGPASLRALRTIREVAAGAILGNHDLHAVARWLELRPERPRDTLDELLAAPDVVELMEWLRKRPVMVVWDDLAMVHAGLKPNWDVNGSLADRLAANLDWETDPMDDPDVAFATTVRECGPDGTRPGSGSMGAGASYRPWYRFYRGNRTVVFGHWAQRGLVEAPRVRGLDTGCVWGGRLTAWLAERDTFVSVAAHASYQEIETE